MIINRPTNLRNTLILKYDIISVLKNILAHADLPYTFDELKKPWWRYYGELYGFSYSRVHRSFDIWISNGLKKNTRLFMPFLIKMPPKKINTTITWKKRTFLYKNTFNNLKFNWFNLKYFKKINLFNPIFNHLTKEAIYYNLPGNIEHYSVNPTGLYNIGNENIYSGFNSKWHKSNKYSSGFYKLNGFAPTNNLIGVNNFYMWTSLFINLYDSTITLYPQNFLKYYNKIFKISTINIIKPYLLNIIHNWINFYNRFNYTLVNNYISCLKNLIISNIKYICLLKLLNKHNKYINIYLLCLFNNFNKHILNNIEIRNTNYLNLNNNLININYLYKKKIVFKKEKLLNKIKYDYLKKFFIFKKLRKQTLNFVNIYKALWSNKYLNYLNKNKIKKYKNYYIINLNNLHFKKKYNLNIKKILSYGKLFLRIPSFLIKQRLGYLKASSLISYKSLFRASLFVFFKKNIYKKISKFTNNFFFIINLLINLNFGLSYKLYLKNNNNDFLFIKNHLIKYLLFFNNILLKNNKYFILKKTNVYYLNILNNSIKFKNTFINYRNIFKFYKNKIKYLDFCYKGIIVKLFKKI